MALFEHIWVLYKALSLLHSPLLPPAREELQLTLEHVRTLSCNTGNSDKHVASNTCNVYPPWSSPRPPRPNTRSSSLGPASSWRTVTENLCLCRYTGVLPENTIITTHLGWGPVAEPGEDTAHLGLAPPEHFSAVMGPTF